MSSNDTSSNDTDRDDGPEAAESQEKPKLALEVKIESPGTCQRHVTVSVPRPDIDRYLTEAYDELVPKAEVPGFRPGRAPRKLVESRFKDQVEEQVKGSLLTDALGQVSDDHEFSAISEPDFDFDAVSIPEDGDLKFEFDIEVRPDFESPQWKGLKLERPVREISDNAVDAQLEHLLSRYGKLVEREGAVEANDMVEVDITVSDGDDVVNKSQEIRVRATEVLSLRDATLSDFGKLIVGVKKGETCTTKVTVSEGAENEAMRGKELDVAFLVKQINYVEPPQLSQSFLEEIGGFEDEDELRETVRGEMERQAQYAQQQRLREEITSQLTQDADWDLPPELVKRQARRELERAVLELQRSGFTGDMVQKHANEIRQNSLEKTERAIKEHFIFERIAEDEEIDASEADYDMEISLIAQQSDEPARRVRARLEKRGQMDALRNQIIERKVVDLICSEAEYTDVPLGDLPTDDTFALNLAISGSRDSAEIPEAKHGGDAESLRKQADHS